MNLSSTKNGHLVFAYPLYLGFAEVETEEVFITLDETNLYVEPLESIWTKMAATAIYLMALCGCFVQYTFVVYEMNGLGASYRTAINQLVSACYFMVSCLSCQFNAYVSVSKL